jgi:hypothetical protein
MGCAAVGDAVSAADCVCDVTLQTSSSVSKSPNGSVLVLPHDTNIAFTYEMPASKRLTGQRISVTVRAFRG